MHAAIVVIGDEVLHGATQDTNSGWLAKRLTDLGIPPTEIRVVGDTPERIQGSVWELQERRGADVVLTCGGLGPTHDDRTVDAVAGLHGVPLVVHGPTCDWLTARYRRLHEDRKRPTPDLNAAALKMCLVPRGAEVHPNEAGAAPGLVLRRPAATRDAEVWTFVLPGVPQELQTLWSAHMEGALQGLAGDRLTRRHVRELVYRGFESEAAAVITRVAEAHPEVAVGSYPHWGRREVVLRVSGTDETAVERALSALDAAMRHDGHRVEALSSHTEPNP